MGGFMDGKVRRGAEKQMHLGVDETSSSMRHHRADAAIPNLRVASGTAAVGGAWCSRRDWCPGLHV